jgi:hypothetical protein
MILVLAISFSLPNVSIVTTAQAASKVKLNKTKVTLNIGDTVKLKVSGTKKKVTWKSSSKKVAAVSSAGKVTAKKQGTAKITASVSGKKYICKVTVKKSVDDSDPVQQLKDYIRNKGTLNTGGNYFISEKTSIGSVASSAGIVYDLDDDEIQFVCILTTDSGTMTVYMPLPYPSTSVEADVTIKLSMGATAYVMATFDSTTYTDDSTVYFQWLTGYLLTESNTQELANTCLQAAFSTWNYILMNNTNLTMKDIGFTSY